jgi:uncharacterized membrane-anchored protein YitT (DUF2179 family)
MSSGAPAADGESSPVQRHAWYEDAQALLIGTLFVSLGLLMFRHVGLMTGGTVGLALLVKFTSGWAFGPVFFAINLPFYWLAWKRMGLRFTVKTLTAVSLLALLSETLPQWISLQAIHPVFAALAGGLLIGTGFIILFRHKASLGGLNMLVLWLQDRFGWRAGVVQMALDALILLAAWPWVDAPRLALSVLAAVAMNVALAVNHKPGRYIAF